MNVLFCREPGIMAYDDVPVPVPGKDQALIKIRRIGICGTDIHAFEGTQPYFSYPRILGHELSGELVSEDIPGFSAGEAVTIIPYFNCGHCIACRSSKPNCCTHIKVFGVHMDGGMCEFISVPSYALVKSGGLSLDALALAEPLAIGAHGVRRAAITAGEFVLVTGAGPIGLGTMAFARLSGANVIAMDTNDSRLACCREKLGIVFTINPRHENVAEKLRAITSGDMPGVVIDATGNIGAINSGIDWLAHGGRYVLIGLQKASFSFPHPEFHKREATLMSSRNATREDFNRVITAMINNQIKPETYITHRVPFDKAGEFFNCFSDPAFPVIKAMISMR